MATTKELYTCAFNSFREKFVNSEFIEGDQPGFNDSYYLRFKVSGLILDIVSDKSCLAVYLTSNDQINYLPAVYPQLQGLLNTKENINFIVDFLYRHRGEIFPEES